MKLTSQILSATCETPTFWPAKTTLVMDDGLHTDGGGDVRLAGAGTTNQYNVPGVVNVRPGDDIALDRLVYRLLHELSDDLSFSHQLTAGAHSQPRSLWTGTGPRRVTTPRR